MWGIYLLLKRVGVSLSIASSVAATEAVQVELAGEAGPYQVLTWKKQWPGCEYEDGVKEGRFTLVEKAGGQWLRAFFPQGAVGPNEGGGGWRMPFARRDEAELTYQLCFEEGFDFKKGGKLPGLCGGPKTITGGDAVSGRDGFSVRLMWRKEGRGQAYVYHMDQPSKYGDEFNFPEGFRFSAGVPVTIRMVLRINTPSKKMVTSAFGPAYPAQPNNSNWKKPVFASAKSRTMPSIRSCSTPFMAAAIRVGGPLTIARWRSGVLPCGEVRGRSLQSPHRR